MKQKIGISQRIKRTLRQHLVPAVAVSPKVHKGWAAIGGCFLPAKIFHKFPEIPIENSIQKRYNYNWKKIL